MLTDAPQNVVIPTGGRKLLFAYSCNSSSDCAGSGGAQLMLHALNRFSQIPRAMFHRTPAKGAIRAAQIRRQSRESQNETGLAARTSGGGLHPGILSDLRSPSNRGISVAAFQGYGAATALEGDWRGG
jgi:hypothetical protein